jgi:hypothetical protein
MNKLEKKWRMHDQLQLSAAILAQWWCPVASTKALDLLHYCTGAPPRPSKWPTKLVHFFVVVLFFAVALTAALKLKMSQPNVYHYV